jgi:hypothetical protein
VNFSKKKAECTKSEQKSPSVRRRKHRGIKSGKEDIEGSYRIYNELVRKAHSWKLDLMSNHDQSQDYLEVNYDPRTCVLVVALEDNTELAAMLDSGSTYSLISRETINKSGILTKLPTRKIELPKRLKIGDGAVLTTDETINHIYIQGKKVGITCFLLEDKGAYQLIIGLEILAELGCSIDFAKGLMKIERSHIGVKALRKMKLMPGVPTTVRVTARLPPQLKQLDHMMELNRKYADLGTQM